MNEKYIEFINSIQSICNNIINKTYNQYCDSMLYFKDPYHFKYHNEFLVSQIGFPLENEKILNIYDSFYSILTTNNTIEDGEYSINILPIEYLKENDNFFKKFDGYKIIIEFKQKEMYLQKK